MPSMRCYECGKVKRCRMVLARNIDVGLVPAPPEKLGTHPEYLCLPCARALGYSEKDGA